MCVIENLFLLYFSKMVYIALTSLWVSIHEAVLTVLAHVLLAYCPNPQITWFPDPQHPSSHWVIFGNPQGLSQTLPEKSLLLVSPMRLWSMHFFLLLSWEKYFAIRALYTMPQIFRRSLQKLITQFLYSTRINKYGYGMILWEGFFAWALLWVLHVCIEWWEPLNLGIIFLKLWGIVVRFPACSLESWCSLWHASRRSSLSGSECVPSRWHAQGAWMPRNHWATQGGNIYLESFKNRDPAKRVGNPMSKWLWDITLGMEAEAGSGMADQKRDTLPTWGMS